MTALRITFAGILILALVEQVNRFHFVVNLKTAKALALTIPQSVLNRADEVFE
jgi:ABC-type uncharacterized transport system substrate-binding protein